MSLSTLMIFVDGLGLGPTDPSVNPLYRGHCPHLERLLRDHATPMDAQLGVPGLPQSATGQATLLTGVNAAKHVGRHVEGFPGEELKELIRRHNLFDELIRRGYRTTFANAYYSDRVSRDALKRRQSVTTVAVLHAFSRVRGPDEMMRNRAVYQDLTRRTLVPRGYEGPVIRPREAAHHLLSIAADYDFTLFEYFQTDLAGHQRNDAETPRMLRELDEFLERVSLFGATPGQLLVLASDHGNLEDAGTTQHTSHPVPLVALGTGAEALQATARSLETFAGALLAFYPPRSG